MPGTPETFVQNTFITDSRAKLIVNWQQLGFSNKPNSVAADHVNPLQSLKNFSRSFYKTWEDSREKCPFQSSILWADKKQVKRYQKQMMTAKFPTSS